MFTTFSPEGILEAMEPGREYRTGLIAQSLRASNVEVRLMLDQMVANGRLSKRFDERGKEFRFHLTPGQTPQVAQRRSLGDVLSRVMTGYEDEMRQRAALCMAMRRYA